MCFHDVGPRWKRQTESQSRRNFFRTKVFACIIKYDTVLAGLVTATGNFGLKLNYGGNSSYNESQLELLLQKTRVKYMEAVTLIIIVYI